MSLSSIVMAHPATLEQRLRVIRRKRTASRRSDATTMALWITGLTALVTVGVANLVSGH
ncbi:MAG TPA: hypothetical protein VLK30_10655 [Candidatus Limnocylindrales bacterium]|nr:hypothetical protein [Candidatus Limnocylindrales bacterium]